MNSMYSPMAMVRGAGFTMGRGTVFIDSELREQGDEEFETADGRG